MNSTTFYKINIGFLIFWLPIFLSAQDQSSDDFKGKLDIGINATTVLSHFVGNESLSEPSQFPLLFRIRNKKSAFRIGIGANGSSNDFFDVVSGNSIKSSSQSYAAKIGIEFDAYTQKKWGAYWGLEGLTSYTVEKATNFSNSGDIETKNTISSFGGGPFLGIKFLISKRLYLSTEANIIAELAQTKITQTSIFGTTELQNTTEFLGAIQAPLYLFLNYKF